VSRKPVPLVAGNWKMNKTASESRDFCKHLRASWSPHPRVELAVFPPFMAIEAAVRELAGCRIAVGAQNLHPAVSGAFTGEISAGMLLTAGCSKVIIGHSERRQLLGESDEFCAEKVESAMQAGLEPVFCVGETLAQRKALETEAVVARQLAGMLAMVAEPGSLVVAYEPVWAIGTGVTASPEQAQEVHQFIRRTLVTRWGRSGESIRILYGGSVKPDNARELLSKPDVNGALVGGASLEVEPFVNIAKAAI
jgi:triosephosphate isomerase (TIM)